MRNMLEMNYLLKEGTKGLGGIVLFAGFINLPTVTAVTCDAGQVCYEPHVCCGEKCCSPNGYDEMYRSFKLSMWNMWYFWFIVIFVVMSCFGGCGYWRRRRLMLGGGNNTTSDFTTVHMTSPMSFPLSSRRSPSPASTNITPSITIPVFFSRTRGASRLGHSVPTEQEQTISSETQSSFPAPPDYSEVVSKPDAYPIYSEKECLPPYSGYAAEEGGVTSSGTAQSHQPGNGVTSQEAVSSRNSPPPAYFQ